MSGADERQTCTPEDEHCWISTNVPGLLTRWVIQCSVCGSYNVDEMNMAVRVRLTTSARMAREELVELLNSIHLYYDTGSHYELSTEDAADAILAAGYRKEWVEQ